MLHISEFTPDYIRKPHAPQDARQGFTLIEISIVLVIIGLIVGGILAGRDLIKAAEIRATVSQVEKYNTATTTFRLKYNGLPGDLSNAATFGLEATGQIINPGWGDGNGVLESNCLLADGGGGEILMFWKHLSQANLIGDSLLSVASYACHLSALTDLTTILPASDLGEGNRFSVAPDFQGGVVTNPHWFLLGRIVTIEAPFGNYQGNPGLTPQEAFQIDTKLDDGNPATGTIISLPPSMLGPKNPFGGNATPTAGTHCYDSDPPEVYSMSTSAHANSKSCQIGIRTSF